LRDESIALLICALDTKAALPVVLYDWGVSQEPFPDAFKKFPLMTKSKKYDLEKTNNSVVFGNPVDIWNMEESKNFSELVVLDWGISKSVSRDRYQEIAKLIRKVVSALEKVIGTNLKLSIKVRNDSLPASIIKKIFGSECKVIEGDEVFESVFSRLHCIALHNNSTSQYELSANKIPQVNIANLIDGNNGFSKFYFQNDIGFSPRTLAEIFSLDKESLIFEMLKDKSGIEYSYKKCARALVGLDF
jgi:hypothetical protein